MKRARLLPTLLSVVLLSAALPLLVVTSAHAEGEVGLSVDGQHWGSALRSPLFQPGVRWVPGDERTRSFYVRNEGPSDARLTIEVRSSDGDELLGRDDVEIDARTRGGGWLRLVNGEPSASLAAGTIRRGGVVRVDVNVRFLWESPNESQRDQLPLDFVVTLTQPGAAGDAGDGPDGNGGADGHGLLPDTGSAVTRGLVWLAAILIGSGVALLVARRRDDTRRRDDAPEAVPARG